MNDPFWTKDPSILYKDGRYLSFFPTSNMTKNETFNSLTRFFIYLILLCLLFSLSYTLIYLSLIIIVMLVLFSGSETPPSTMNEKILNEPFCENGICEKKVKCTTPTFDNPFMNVGLIDYVDDPNRPEACLLTDKNIGHEADQYMKYNLFFNAGDPFERKFAERSFYTMPVTTIPNDTIAFAQSLFRQPESCKINPANCYRYEDIRFNRINPALDGDNEVFYRDPFGNLN